MPSLSSVTPPAARGLLALLLVVASVPVTGSAFAAKGDCSQPSTNGVGPAASDCLFILKAAVGTVTCTPACVCAPQDGVPITAADALRCLRKAVGQDVSLDCGCEVDAVVRVHYPTETGETITIRGNASPLSWETDRPCTKTSDVLWTCNTGVTSGHFEYKPVLNGITFAVGMNYELDATDETDIYPFFFATEGTVQILHNVLSTKLGNSRDVAVYLPPSYFENTAKHYPVLFMQDGQNLFDPNLAFGGEWEVDESLDALSLSGSITEIVVVAPYNNVDRIDEYTPTEDESITQGGKGDLYLDFLLQELKPMIASTYRIDPDVEPGIAGSSLGGLIAIYGAWTRYPGFSRVAALSPSLFWDDVYVNQLISADSDDEQGLKIYLDVGSSESGIDLVTELRDVLIGKGWTLGEDLQYVLGSGQAHNEAAWRSRFPGAMTFLYPDRDRAGS